MPLLLLGCFGSPDFVNDADSDGDADADTDTDTDTDTDADPAFADCPAYSGFSRVGAEWSYRTPAAYESANGVSGTGDQSLVGTTDGVIEMTSVSHWVYDTDSRYASDWIFHYRCDTEGLWQVDGYGEWESSVGASTTFGWTQTLYDAPPLVRIPTLAVGTEWSTTYAGQSSDSYGNVTEISGRYDYVVPDETESDVPAGRYTTLELSMDYGTGVASTWLDRDVGTVRSEYFELVEHRP